jgi:hypothetical protein
MKNKIFFSICLSAGILISAHSFSAVNVQVNPDGTKFTGVLVNGSTSGKYDIVFVGDGFTSSAADQASFNSAVTSAVNALRNKHPYMDNICAFNIWRVNVVSAESGVDHPVSNVTKNTELNCSFGDNVSTPERVIFSSTPQKVTEAANFAPAHDAIYVLVNDPEYGGAAGSIVFTSLNTSMNEVIVHELGHFVGRLADEYTCYFCDGRTEPAYSGPEPQQVNITTQTNRTLIKWNSFINPATPIPTTVDNPAGVVGLWAGGGYSPTGIFRPQFNCLMRSLNNELCAVCNSSLSGILRPFCTVCERDPGSLACILSLFRHRFDISRSPIRLKIPDCCFCPLDIDRRRKVEIELSINQKGYKIQVTDGSKEGVKADISSSENGGTRISFDEQKSSTYFIVIAPVEKSNQAVMVDAKLSRDGKQVVLF